MDPKDLVPSDGVRVALVAQTGVADDERLAAAYQAARTRMQALLLAAPDPDVTVPACPDWRARDLVAHVTALAADLSGGCGPTGDTQVWVDQQVEDRRERQPATVVDEWSSAGPAFEAMIAAKPHRWWGLVYDELVHEHDLRAALGDLDGRQDDDTALAARLGLRLVALDLAKHGVPALRVVLDGDEHIVGEGDAELTLTATSYDALRLLGSRRTLDEIRAADFDGDLERYLPALVHMELPATSLAE